MYQSDVRHLSFISKNHIIPIFVAYYDKYHFFPFSVRLLSTRTSGCPSRGAPPSASTSSASPPPLTFGPSA